MPSIWPFAGASASAAAATNDPSSSSSRTSNKDTSQAASPAPTSIPPLIICEGFLSAAQSVVWGNEFRLYLGVGHQQLVDQLCSSASSTRPKKRRSDLGSARTVVFAPIGPVSSLHDRACELFYALRGGTVDYGLEHSRQHGHSRYGRHYPQALCPSWGPETPAHFLGHSLGGPTILKLQQLLRQGFFDHALPLKASDGWMAEDLMLSITSVSSPFRGTPLVYSLGSEPLPYPKVRMFSFGDLLSKFIHVAAFLDLPFFDAHADAWHFSARRRAIRRTLASGAAGETHSLDDTERAVEKSEQETAGLKEFLRQLWKSDWAGGRDCAPWDCTFAERELDREEDLWGLELPEGRKRRGRTWYRSYAGGMTVQEESGFHRPESYWSLSPLTYTSHLIGHFDYSRLSPTPSFLVSCDEKQATQTGKEGMALPGLSSTWWENDGVVPLASQFHPFDCHPDRCRHFQGMPASLPFGKRQRRSQSTDLRPSALSPSLAHRSSTSESETLVEIDTSTTTEQETKSRGQGTETSFLLPLPATQNVSSNRSMLATAGTAAKIAYMTSLRVMRHDERALPTPSDEELSSFLPDLSTCPSSSSPPIASEREQKDDTVEEALMDPQDNKWYTFQIDNLDHTSLCPFWTGSEVQKQFWSGIGFFLASVDRKVGYSVEQEQGSRTSTVR